MPDLDLIKQGEQGTSDACGPFFESARAIWAGGQRVSAFSATSEKKAARCRAALFPGDGRGEPGHPVAAVTNASGTAAAFRPSLD
jgi:hypothetical protein